MIYISLTTVPDRMNFEQSSRQNLVSLLTQNTDKKYKVLYNVPFKYTARLADNIGRLPQNTDKGDEIQIPQWVEELKKEYDHLIINRLKDYGPPTKIVGALQYTDKKDDTLIILDDDNLYHPDMLEYHLKKLEQYPDSAIAFRGDRLLQKRTWTDEEGNKKFTFAPMPDVFPLFYDHNIMITGHWHSVSYKRSFFEDDFLNEEFIFNNHWSDDILVGYYAYKHKKDIKCVAWDKETDWRVINTLGRNCNSFPVLDNLPFPDHTGCHVLRNITGTHVNDQVTYPEKWVKEMMDHYHLIIHQDG